MNYLSNLDETYREQPLPATDDLNIFWRSKDKGHGHTLVQVYGGEGVHVDAEVSGFHLVVWSYLRLVGITQKRTAEVNRWISSIFDP